MRLGMIAGAAVIGLLFPGGVWAQGATLSYSLHQAFEGHPGRIQSAAFSPDGVLLATGDDQGTIKLWDVVGEREVATLKGRGSVTALAFSPDHKVLVSGHTDRTVIVWNTESGGLLKTLQGHKGAVYAVAVSPDGQVVASAGDDRVIRLWGTKLGNEMGTLDGHEGRVVSLAFSRDGRTLISGSDDKTLRLWDPTKRKEIRNIAESGGKFGTLFAAASSPDLQVVAVAITEVKKDTSNRRSMSGPPIWDKVIKVRSGATGEELVALRGHLQDVKTVSVSADGRFLASGSPDQTVRLWDVTSGTEITTIAQKAAVTAVAFSPDGRWLAAGGDEKKVFVWKTTGVMPPTEVARLPGVAPEIPRGAPVEIFPPVDVDSLPAAKTPQKKNAYAVVIGIEQYRDLPKVDFAARDAATVKEYLVHAMGYPEENIILMTNDRATKSSLEARLETWLPNNVEEGSEVFVFYAGHGSPKPKGTDSYEAYLVPYDGDPSFLEDTAYPLQRLYQSLTKLQQKHVKHVLVVLDSCFSGAGGRSVIAKGTRFMALTVEDPLLAPPGVTVLAAASGAQVSTFYQEKRHGIFTYFFLKGLQGEADANHDGTVDIGEMFDYVMPNVKKTAMKLNNKEQTPQLLTALDPAARARLELVQLAK